MKNKVIDEHRDKANAYARDYYKKHRAERIASSIKSQKKKKAKDKETARINKRAEEALDKLFVKQYISSFDNFFVQLHVGPFKTFIQAQPGANPEATKFDITGKNGLTIITPDMVGVLIWLPEWFPTPEHIGLLFHELTHAAIRRYEQDGIGKKGDVQAMNEFIAYSIDEFGRYFLEELNAEFGKKD